MDESKRPSAVLTARAASRGLLLVLAAAGAAAWAAGCSDDPGPATPESDAGPDAPPQLPDAGGSRDAPPPGRDCSNDLNDEQIWAHLECSGLYSSFADKQIAPDVLPYKPAAELWSDGAEKHRWIYLPPGTKIDISDWNEWIFPVGTKIWKEFKFGGKRIETRLFAKIDTAKWTHTSYRWNADETDAVAKSGGESIPGLGPDGGTYEIPNAGQCEQCHFGRKDNVLGFDAVSIGMPGAEGVSLADLAAQGKLSATPPATAMTVPVSTADTGGAKAVPAVMWLHANCGACHNANTNAAASFTNIHFLVRADQLAPTDGGAPATVQQLDVYQKGWCKPSVREEPDAGVGAKYMYIRGGDPARSLVSVLSGRRVPEGVEPNSSVQMPPILTRAVDVVGHGLLDDWITAMPPCP
jgi:hypothetical protein